MTQARIQAAQARYAAAMHAVQSGVAIDVADGEKNVEPKHLRTGINSALVDAGALAHLLIRQGVISEVDYFESLADMAEEEKTRYEKELSTRKGMEIRLG